MLKTILKTGIVAALIGMGIAASWAVVDTGIHMTVTMSSVPVAICINRSAVLTVPLCTAAIMRKAGAQAAANATYRMKGPCTICG